jgi:hypothetical protein
MVMLTWCARLCIKQALESELLKLLDESLTTIPPGTQTQTIGTSIMATTLMDSNDNDIHTHRTGFKRGGREGKGRERGRVREQDQGGREIEMA